MKKLKSLFISLAFLLFSSPWVAGQTTDNQLKGMHTFKLGVELAGATKECGITEKKVRAALIYATASAPFKVTGNTSALVPIINALVATVKVQDGSCFSSIIVNLNSHQFLNLEATKRGMFVMILHWNHWSLEASPSRSHGVVVTQAIEAAIAGLNAAWIRDNQ